MSREEWAPILDPRRLMASGYESCWLHFDRPRLARPTLQRLLGERGVTSAQAEAFIAGWMRARKEMRRLNRMTIVEVSNKKRGASRGLPPCPRREWADDFNCPTVLSLPNATPDEQALVGAIALQTVSLGVTDTCLERDQLQELSRIPTRNRFLSACSGAVEEGYIQYSRCQAWNSTRGACRLANIEDQVKRLGLFRGAVDYGTFCPVVETWPTRAW